MKSYRLMSKYTSLIRGIELKHNEAVVITNQLLRSKSLPVSVNRFSDGAEIVELFNATAQHALKLAKLYGAGFILGFEFLYPQLKMSIVEFDRLETVVDPGTLSRAAEHFGIRHLLPAHLELLTYGLTVDAEDSNPWLVN